MDFKFPWPKHVTVAQNPYRKGIDDMVDGIFQLYDQGTYTPFLIVHDFIPIQILLWSIFGLYYLNGKAAVFARFGAFALIALSASRVMVHARTLGLAYGYGVGLFAAVSLMHSATLLIVNDPTKDFKRLELKREEKSRDKDIDVAGGKGTGVKIQQENGNLTHRTANDQVFSSKDATSAKEDLASTKTASPFHWQPYPSGFWHRLDWALDLTTSFRGPGWNWRLHTFEPLSDDPSTDLPSPVHPKVKRSFFVRNILKFIFLYLVIDGIKVAMMYDDYFVGTAPLDSPPPSYLVRYFPPLSHSPVLTRNYRLILSCASVLIALNYIFALCPIFYGFLLPHLLPQSHYTPLSAPFLYPPQQNSFSHVLDSGLAGWWGQWWHQMFRFGISEPSSFAVKRLGWNPKSPKARVLQVAISFMITGLIHAAGSYTMYKPTHPFRPFLYFILQGIGVLYQTVLCKTLLSPLITNLPRPIRRAGNFVFVAIWQYFTGPLFADDIAASALWNLEPVPVSLFRGLGLGLEGEGWWCWHGKWVIWYDGGGSWWKSGFGIV